MSSRLRGRVADPAWSLTGFGLWENPDRNPEEKNRIRILSSLILKWWYWPCIPENGPQKNRIWVPAIRKTENRIWVPATRKTENRILGLNPGRDLNPDKTKILKSGNYGSYQLNPLVSKKFFDLHFDENWCICSSRGPYKTFNKILRIIHFYGLYGCANVQISTE